MLTEYANAKINLSLNIISKESSGYHCLDMVSATVSLTDAVSISLRADSQVTVKFLDGEITPPDIAMTQNIAYKAAHAFIREFGTLGADITITKNIPVRAGLGGSSADGAAVLNAMLKLHPNADRAAAVRLALGLGADIPYMMQGGYARVGGIGGQITKLDGIPEYDCCLTFADGGVDTAACFCEFDKMYPGGGHCPADTDKLIAALKRRDYPGIAKYNGNALTQAATMLNPGIKKCLSALEGSGAQAVFMTGSGSGSVGLYSSNNEASRAGSALKAQGHYAKVCKIF